MPFEVLTMGRAKYLGGSPTNVAVARHGHSSAVITKTGTDPFGDFVRRALDGYGVDSRFVGPAVPAQVAAEDLSFGETVKRGACVSPPAGVPDPASVVDELARLDAELFVIVEQDLYPCAPDVPLPIAVRTRQHLAGCGLSGARRPHNHR